MIGPRNRLPNLVRKGYPVRHKAFDMTLVTQIIRAGYQDLFALADYIRDELGREDVSREQLEHMLFPELQWREPDARTMRADGLRWMYEITSNEGAVFVSIPLDTSKAFLLKRYTRNSAGGISAGGWSRGDMTFMNTSDSREALQQQAQHFEDTQGATPENRAVMLRHELGL